MRLLWLFLRSRLSERVVAGLLAVSGLAWAWGAWLSQEEGPLKVALILFPIFCGAILANATCSPFGEHERIASRSLVGLRTIQIAGLVSIAAAGLVAAVWAWPVLDAEALVIRNLAGFCGLGLLTAVVIGARLAWIVPVGYGLASFVVGSESSSPWALTSSPASSDLAIGIALAALAAGLVLICHYGARDSVDH